MEDKMSLMDKMSESKKSNPDQDQKVLDMFNELDEKGKAEIISKLEDMCGYYAEDGEEEDMVEGEGKGKGVTIVIAKGK
jgi:hypothetical protein